MKVQIPTPLFSYTKNRAFVAADGASVELATRDLDRQFPGIRFRIIDEQDRIRPHIKIFVNRAQIFDLKTPLSPDDEVAIIQAFSGG